MFNNRIYGLTKGQYSPTSEPGKKTKSTPMGSIDHPFEPCAVALGADATFIGRTVDIFVKEQRALLLDAHAHKGASFVEIFQNCNIFNDGAFEDITDRKLRAERVLWVEHGQPLVFGDTDAPKGLVLDRRLQLATVDVTDDNRDEILVHDETNPVLAGLLCRLRPPFPVAMGVLYRVQRGCYEDGVHAQLDQARARAGAGDLGRALLGNNTWTVE
jgi:2-oxoglutarate ferredoxin oxidoreductase subunit beta